MQTVEIRIAATDLGETPDFGAPSSSRMSGIGDNKGISHIRFCLRDGFSSAKSERN
jgi:hypothetical protein